MIYFLIQKPNEEWIEENRWMSATVMGLAISLSVALRFCSKGFGHVKALGVNVIILVITKK